MSLFLPPEATAPVITGVDLRAAVTAFELALHRQQDEDATSGQFHTRDEYWIEAMRAAFTAAGLKVNP